MQAFPDVLLSPLGAGLLLALLLWLLRRRLPRWALWSGFALELLCYALMTPLGANALVGAIEARAPRPSQCPAPRPATIVVLAGGMEHAALGPDDASVLSTASVRRLLAAVDLWRATPGATLVVSGGGPFDLAEATLLAHFAMKLGVPSAAIRTETHSQTTWGNALDTRRLDGVPARIWLVTSALHMPRALLAFRAAGFDACGFPADFRYLPPQGLGDALPQSGALQKSEAALHELVGMLLYRGIVLKHRIAGDMPAPRAASGSR